MEDAVTLQYKKTLLKTPVLSIPQVLHLLLGLHSKLLAGAAWLSGAGHEGL
jgi:hypothetical protein